MGFGFSPKIVTDGLIYYLDTYNPNSYISGSLKWNNLLDQTESASLNTDVQVDGNALYFNGVNSSGSVDSIVNSEYPISMEAWFKIDDTSSNRFIFGFGNSASTGQYKHLSYDSATNTISWHLRGVTSGFNIIVSGSTIQSNKWYQAVGTSVNSATHSFYMDGELQRTDNYDIQTSTNNIGRIGVFDRSSGQANFFSGSISNIKIYNKVLSADEVRQNYNALKGRFGLT